MLRLSEHRATSKQTWICVGRVGIGEDDQSNDDADFEVVETTQGLWMQRSCSRRSMTGKVPVRRGGVGAGPL